MRIDDIKIYPCFAAHEPKPEKMEQKEQYFTETGLLQSQIIFDSWGNLIDRVFAGDKVLIHTKRGVRVVTVAAVEEYAGNEPEPLRMVIRVKRKGGAA